MAQNTIFCIDNSLNSTNGDFAPTRLAVQQEAAYEIAQLRLQSNLFNHVAILTMAGSRPEVTLALSRNTSQLQRKLFAIQTAGQVDPLTTIRIAQLMHKSKQRRNLTQRVALRLMLFIGSVPAIDADSQGRLLAIAKDLLKDQVQVDVIAFGLLAEATQIATLFQPFVDQLGPGSQLVKVFRGYDFFRVLFGELNSLRGQGRLDMFGMANATDEEDPELLMAIALSIQEAEMNSAKQQAEASATPKTAADSSAVETAKTNTTPTVTKEPEIRPSDTRPATPISTDGSSSSGSTTPSSSPIKSATALVEKDPGTSQPANSTSTPNKVSKVNKVNAKKFNADDGKVKKFTAEKSSKTVRSLDGKTTFKDGSTLRKESTRPNSKGSARRRKTAPMVPLPTPKTGEAKANPRLAATDDGKRRVKRTKQNFNKFVTSINAKSLASKTVTRSPAANSTGSKLSEKTTKIGGARVRNRYRTTSPTTENSAASTSDHNKELQRNLSDIFKDAKLKLFFKVSPSKLDASTSASNLLPIKLESWIFRNPDLIPEVPYTGPAATLFGEKQPQKPKKEANVNQTRIQEMINTKMRALNIASSSKIGLDSDRSGERSKSPCSARNGSRASSPPPNNIIAKISDDNGRVTVLKQGATECEPTSQHKSPPPSRNIKKTPNKHSSEKSNSTSGSGNDKKTDPKKTNNDKKKRSDKK